MYTMPVHYPSGARAGCTPPPPGLPPLRDSPLSPGQLDIPSCPDLGVKGPGKYQSFGEKSIKREGKDPDPLYGFAYKGLVVKPPKGRFYYTLIK